MASIGAPATLLGAAGAQQADRIYRIGILAFPRRHVPPAVAIVDELHAASFIEGKNLIVDERGFGLRDDQFATVVRQMAQSNVDVLVGLSGGTSIRGAQAAMTTIPIFGVADDMVQEGFVGSLVNCDGNTTGISILAIELNGKRQEILMEMLPKAPQMAALADAGVRMPAQIGALQEAARRRSVDLLIKSVENPRMHCPRSSEPRPSTSAQVHCSTAAAGRKFLPRPRRWGCPRSLNGRNPSTKAACWPTVPTSSRLSASSDA
jgi:hypothetical protein